MATVAAGGSQPMTGRQAGLTLIGLVTVWGLSWPIFKYGLEYLPPFWFGAVRMGSACAVLMAYMAWAGRLRVPRRSEAPILFTLGVLLMGLYPAFTHTGLLWVESGRASILAYLTPLWVTPGAILLLGERLTRLKAAGLGLAIGGLAVLFNPAGFDWSREEVVIGNGLLVMASITWAAAILHIRTVRWRLSPIELAPWQLLIAAILLALLALATEPAPFARLDWELVPLLVYSGPLTSILTVWGLMAINRALPAITTAFGYLATPVCGLLFGAALRGEALTATNLGGLALIVAGLGAVAIAEARERGHRV
ncbi:MAG: DMT family transporter [Rhodospirillaceae bacterium]